MRLKNLATLPEYTDGCFELYDITDQDGIRKIKPRGIGKIWYREIAIYDRTRLTFEQADTELTHKIRIQVWNGISSNCVCVIDGQQNKVMNKTDVLSAQGYMETELTLINPTMDYEVWSDDESGTG
jgi:hypothetical protein